MPDVKCYDEKCIWSEASAFCLTQSGEEGLREKLTFE